MRPEGVDDLGQELMRARGVKDFVVEAKTGGKGYITGQSGK